MVIKIGRRLEISNPRNDLMMFCKKNLILRNPDYDNKIRMGFWVGNTPEYLYLYETNGNRLILPYGLLESIKQFFQQGDMAVPEFEPQEKLDFRSDVPLYDYQELAVSECVKKHCGILKSKAGSGKTQMGIAMIGRLHLKTLWLTHTIDLLNQSHNRARQYMDEADLGKIVGGKVAIGRVVTFATVQTMANQDLTQLRKEWDVIIVDECHRVCSSAKGYTLFSKVLNNLEARYKYGLSATVHRADGLIRATFSLLGNVIYEVPEESVRDTTIKPSIKLIQTAFEITDDCLNGDGTLNNAELLNVLTGDKDRNKLIINTLEEGKSSLILSDRLEHLETLMRICPYPEKAMISGKMSSKRDKALRQQIIEDMKSGKLKYLFATYTLCKEGLDIPRLERLYMTTPQKDYAVVAQSIGRVSRTFEGKTEAVVYDFVDVGGYFIRKWKQRCRTYKKEGCNVES